MVGYDGVMHAFPFGSLWPNCSNIVGAFADPFFFSFLFLVDMATVLKQTSFKTLEGGDITRTGAQPLELQDKAEKINNPKILATGVEQTASNGIGALPMLFLVAVLVFSQVACACFAQKSHLTCYVSVFLPVLIVAYF